jgi:hypothetical protein
MVDWPGGKVIIVEQLLPKARERLVTVTDDARLIEAAKLLQAAVELVIVWIPPVFWRASSPRLTSWCKSASVRDQIA